jgi:shikimate dehydrogenase
MKMTEKNIPQYKIKNFIDYMKKNNLFYAAAVTMPYKKFFYNISRITDDITRYSKSVNLIVKNKKRLFGYNTDILSLIKILSKFKKKNILVIGMGGTGEAIINVFKKKYKNSRISVITRKNRLKKKKNIFYFKKNSKDVVGNKDLIINCTPLGSSLGKNYINRTPIKKNLFKYINKNSVIFDLVYSPKNTKLSRMCRANKIRYLNGLEMNTMQANIALNIAFKKYL